MHWWAIIIEDVGCRYKNNDQHMIDASQTTNNTYVGWTALSHAGCTKVKINITFGSNHELEMVFTLPRDNFHHNQYLKVSSSWIRTTATSLMWHIRRFSITTLWMEKTFRKLLRWNGKYCLMLWLGLAEMILNCCFSVVLVKACHLCTILMIKQKQW